MTETAENKSTWKERLLKRIWVLKAVLVSQLSGLVDFVASYLSFRLLGIAANYSAGIGAITGGITNCALNYKWTFKAGNCPVPNVVTKYVMVWVGSLLLNSYGTGWLNTLFENSLTLDEWGVTRDMRFTVARLGVSLMVSVFWNLLLQKVFVYRNVRFDIFLNRIFKNQTT